jgi:hypothetical protein
MDAYDLHEARLLQYGVATSGANGLAAASGAVPAGKVWTILAAFITVSVAETQAFWFSILKAGLDYFPITFPVSFAVDPAVNKAIPMLTEGLEIKLYPGEFLYGFRAAATAGSSMTMKFRYIESDLPYYQYIDPQKKVVASTLKHGSVFRATGAISQSGSLGGSGSAGTGFGGQNGGPSEPGV